MNKMQLMMGFWAVLTISHIQRLAGEPFWQLVYLIIACVILLVAFISNEN